MAGWTQCSFFIISLAYHKIIHYYKCLFTNLAWASVFWRADMCSHLNYVILMQMHCNWWTICEIFVIYRNYFKNCIFLCFSVLTMTLCIIIVYSLNSFTARYIVYYSEFKMISANWLTVSNRVNWNISRWHWHCLSDLVLPFQSKFWHNYLDGLNGNTTKYWYNTDPDR